MRLLIWGAGAIGGTVGAYFVRAGHDVMFVDVARDHVKTINEHGLKISGPIEEFRVTAQAHMPDALTGQWETILLCTKAQHTEAATRALLPCLSKDGYVVSVQNGLNELLISELVGEARTVGSFVNFGADYLEPGHIHYGGRGAVVLGELNGEMSDRLEHLHSLFLSFDDKAVTTSNIWGYLWGKMAYGAMLFATALTNDSIADALAHPAYREIFSELAREVMRVALAKGVTPEGFNGFNPNAFLPEASEEDAVKSLDEMVAFNRKSAKTHSGIWRDLAVRKRTTEVDAQPGMVVQVAKSLGVEVPLTEAVVKLIHDIERALDLANLEHLKSIFKEHYANA